MGHRNAIFLSLVSGAALVLGLTPGCSSNNTPPPSVAMVWTVTPGANVGQCNTVNDTFSIGSTAQNPIQTVGNGSSSNGIPVTVSCSVVANSTGYAVNANMQYGNQGSLTISGQIKVGSGAPGPQTGIAATFNDHKGLIASLSETDCTVTFTQVPGMGIAPSRIWGYIDCPKAATSDSQQACDANAQFLFENCSQ